MKCVHCLVEDENSNWDHVFPVSWYPDSTPQNIEKWKVPSCLPCNSEYGKLEQDLLIRFALCLDPNDPAADGIVERALRAIDSGKGRNDRDKRARAGKRKQLLEYLNQIKELPNHGILPDFSHNDPEKYEECIAIPVPKKALERLAEKIVRGVIYLEYNVYLDKNHPINMYLLDQDGDNAIKEKMDRFSSKIERGPGLIIQRALIDGDPTVGFFSIEIWGARKLFVSLGISD